MESFIVCDPDILSGRSVFRGRPLAGCRIEGVEARGANLGDETTLLVSAEAHERLNRCAL
jgi:hypothetical protein